MSFVQQIGGKIGKLFTGAGSGEARLSNTHELLVAMGRGKYAQGAKDGEIFCASIAEAGVALGTALGTTPAFSLHNPDGSKVLASILAVVAGYVSGTVGAGNLEYGKVADAAAPTGGTDITPLCSDFGVSSPGQMNCGTGHTVDATPTLYRPSSINFGAWLASAVEVAELRDDVDGEIIVPEGMTFVMDEKGAGGSSELVILAVVYQEIPNP